MLANVMQQLPTGITFQMSHHTLLMAWRIDFQSSLSIKPHTTLTLPGIAVAADWSVVKLIELLILDVKPIFQIADIFCLVFIIEGWTDIELSVWCQRNARISCPTIVHLREHHAVSEQIQLWCFPINI